MKRLAILFTMLTLVMLCAVSCNKDEGTADYGTATVYTPGTTVNVISALGEDDIAELASALDKILVSDGEGGTVMTSVYTQNAKHEIVVGVIDESRPATVKAQRYLERLDRDSLFEARYVIYAESGTIAVAYDTNSLTPLQAYNKVLKAFVDKHIEGKEYIAFGQGIIESGSIDLIGEQEKIDNDYLAEKWTEFDAAAKAKYGLTVGTKLTDAFRTYYSIF